MGQYGGEMTLARQRTPRTTGLNLVRRAALLGCSYSHLARVIAGKRQSRSLLLRLEKLMESEPLEKAKPTEEPKTKLTQKHKSL